MDITINGTKLIVYILKK